MAALLIDEDVALDTASELRQLGHDAVSVDSLGRRGSKDDAIFWRAVQQRRIVVRHNLNDFALLHRAWHRWGIPQHHPGILVPQQSVVRHAAAVAQAVGVYLRSGRPIENDLCIFRARQVRERYRGVTLSLPGGGIEFELIEPLDDESFVARFLRQRGPGLHHITLEIDDANAAAVSMREHGIEPYNGVRGREGQRETFIHPRDSGGVLFQLIEQHRTYGRPESQEAGETAGEE